MSNALLCLALTSITMMLTIRAVNQPGPKDLPARIMPKTRTTKTTITTKTKTKKTKKMTTTTTTQAHTNTRTMERVYTIQMIIKMATPRTAPNQPSLIQLKMSLPNIAVSSKTH